MMLNSREVMVAMWNLMFRSSTGRNSVYLAPKSATPPNRSNNPVMKPRMYPHTGV